MTQAVDFTALEVWSARVFHGLIVLILRFLPAIKGYGYALPKRRLISREIL